MNEKDMLMFYHTALRNVGLYTSISFATLAYSRVFRNNNYYYNNILILISIIFTMIAFSINYILLNELYDFSRKQDDKVSRLDKWIFIPECIVLIEVILMILGITTLYYNV
jgi:Trk-type K+ transport system membrane component